MKTKIIGLTGGIGSGKSTIARFFTERGIPVYFADDEAKKLLNLPDTVIELTKAFGNDILIDNIPDRKKIAALVFKDKDKLTVLNQIIHPRVAQHFSDWVKQNSGSKFVVKEAAILFESGSYKDCDAIILVTAPLESRIERVMQRDGISRELVLERIANQWNDDKKAKYSSYIINNQNLEQARTEAVKIIKLIEN